MTKFKQEMSSNIWHFAPKQCGFAMSNDQNRATHEKDLAVHRSKNCLKLACTSLCTRNYFENLSGFETYTWILGLGIRNVQNPLDCNWNTSKYGNHTT